MMPSVDGEDFDYRLNSERDDDNLTLKNNKESIISQGQHSTSNLVDTIDSQNAEIKKKKKRSQSRATNQGHNEAIGN
jgi:hypothetical protein